MAKLWSHRKACRLCNSRAVAPGLKFAFTPPEVFTHTPVSADDVNAEKIPVIVSLCEKCRHVQLLDVVSPTVMFDEYPYSGNTGDYGAFYESLAQEIAQHSHLGKGDLIVDIGSGNATLLSIFKRMGFKVVGVDPSRASHDISNAHQISHYHEYFSPALANRIVLEHGKAAAITATFVMGSIDNLHAVAAGIRHLLKPDGLFYMVEPYLADMIQGGMFDQVHHERISLFAATPLEPFFRSVYLHLINVKRMPELGGCLLGVVQRSDGAHVTAPSLAAIIEDENRQNVLSLDSLATFAANAENKKRQINQKVQQAIADGKKVTGLGVTSRTVTFIHECGWGPDVLQGVISHTTHRAGGTIPGTSIPILSWENAPSGNTAALLVFGDIPDESWNQRLDTFKRSGGTVITCV